MKSSLTVITVIGVLCTGLTSIYAAETARVDGPKGGRILEKTEPQAEFHLEKDRTATITFYDAQMQAVPAGDQAVTVIADAATGKQTVEFEKKDDILVSKAALPDGDGYGLVVQLRSTADAKPQNFRFKLETHICDECGREEYACSCHE